LLADAASTILTLLRDPSPSEHAQLEALRRGDEAAYEALVREHTPRLLALARRYLPEEHDAHDVVQEAFLQAFRGLDRFDGQARLSTWLHRITINCALMKLRARSRRPECKLEDLLPRFVEDGHHAAPIAAWSAPEDGTLERAELCAAVRRAIAGLPEPYRDVLVLRDLEGLSTLEAARVIGENENTTKIRLHRARLALRALLDPLLREGHL
jgi:RNA polymerase sigma-70 factor (ECF subfamily)